MINTIKKNIRKLTNIHYPSEFAQNILLFTTPRSGSTWLMEILLSQENIKSCNEPFDIRNYYNANMIGINTWKQLYDLKKSNNLCLKHLNGFIKGKFSYGYKNLIPFEKGYKFFTNKIVFKILHACEDKVEMLQSTFNSKVILLFRHPIPVSLSRKELPRLETFIFGDFNKFFDSKQLQLAQEIFSSGSYLEKAILDWCFQNYLLLNKRKKNWIVLTYEQLVIEPNNVIDILKKEFKDLDVDFIMNNIRKASRTTHKSDSKTKEKFKDNLYDKEWLTERWIDKVSLEDKKIISNILNVFEIDIYKTDSPRPIEKYWI